MADYAAWPTDADVRVLLDACNVTLRVTGADEIERIGRVRAAIVQEIASLTGRQWISDAVDAVRYFDGTGTAELEVDEISTLTSAAVIGSAAQTLCDLADVVIATESGRPYTRLTRGRGSLPSEMLSGVFPAGRQNIAVTGKWGSPIPSDLWEAACGEAAHRIAQEVGYRPTGRVTRRTVGDTTVGYEVPDADATGWHARYVDAVRHYKRSGGRRLRNLRPRMI